MTHSFYVSLGTYVAIGGHHWALVLTVHLCELEPLSIVHYCHAKVASRSPFRDSPVLAFHLAIGALGLDTSGLQHDTMPVDWGDLNSCTCWHTNSLPSKSSFQLFGDHTQGLVLSSYFPSLLAQIFDDYSNVI